MGRIIVDWDAPSVRGGRVSATLVELSDGTRVHVQLYGSDRGIFVKVTRMKWRGLVPAETLFEDDAVLFEFSERGPQDMSPDARTTELLRRLTLIAVNCDSTAEVRSTFEDLERARLYDDDYWAQQT